MHINGIVSFSLPNYQEHDIIRIIENIWTQQDEDILKQKKLANYAKIDSLLKSYNPSKMSALNVCL